MGLVAAGGVPPARLGTAANAGLASWLITLPGAVGTPWVTEGDGVLPVALAMADVVCPVTTGVSLLGEPADVSVSLEGTGAVQDVAVASHVYVLAVLSEDAPTEGLSSAAGPWVLLVASLGGPGGTRGLYRAEVVLEAVEEGAVTVLRPASLLPAAGPVAPVLGVTEDATTAGLVSPSTGGDMLTSGSAVLWPRTGDGAVTGSGAVGDTVPAPATGFWLPGA